MTRLSGLSAIIVSLRVTTACVLPVFLLGGLAVEVRSAFELSRSRIGTGVAVFFLFSAIGATPGGSLVQKTGPGRGLQAASLLGAISLLGLGTSVSYPSLLTFQAVGGLGNAIAQVSSNLLLASCVPDDRQGFAFGLKQAAIPVAAFLTGLAVPGIGLTVGWRWAFRIAAAAVATQVFLIPSAASDVPLRPKIITEQPRMNVVSLVLLASAGGLGAMAANSLAAFFVDSTVSLGISQRHAGFLFAAGSAIAITVRVWGGWVADTRNADSLLLVSTLLLIGAAGYLMIALRTAALIFPGVLLCFGAGWGWPGLLNLAVVNGNRYTPAFATGITHSGAFAGGVLGPLLFGLTVDNVSYLVAWSAASVWAFVGAASILLIRSRTLSGEWPEAGKNDIDR